MPDTWETRLREHALWPVVDSVTAALGGLQLPADSPSADALSRLQWLVATLAAHRDVEDARAYTPGMLDATLPVLTAGVQASLNLYVADPETNPDALRVAGEQVDSVVGAMATWPPLSQKGTAIAAGQAAAAYEKAAKGALEVLSDQADTLTAQLGLLASQAQTAAQAQADANDTVIQELVGKTVASTTAMGKAMEGLHGEASETLARMKELEGEGENIVARIATKGVAKDYAGDARRKAFAGWIWDFFGVAIGLIFGGLLLQHLFSNDAPADGIPLGLTRLAVSVGGLGLAALCFARGRSNHIEARRSKRAHLRLSTAGPFVANMDEEFQDVVLEGMADRIYLQGILTEDESGRYDETLVEKIRARIRARREASEKPPLT